MLTSLHLTWAMISKGKDHLLWSFLGTAECLYSFSHRTLFCSLLEHTKIKSNSRKHVTSTFFFNLADFPTVIQDPGFQTSYRIISAKCSVWNGVRMLGAVPTSVSPGWLREPSGTLGLHRTQLGKKHWSGPFSSVCWTIPETDVYIALFYIDQSTYNNIHK